MCTKLNFDTFMKSTFRSIAGSTAFASSIWYSLPSCTFSKSATVSVDEPTSRVTESAVYLPAPWHVGYAEVVVVEDVVEVLEDVEVVVVVVLPVELVEAVEDVLDVLLAVDDVEAVLVVDAVLLVDEVVDAVDEVELVLEDVVAVEDVEDVEVVLEAVLVVEAVLEVVDVVDVVLLAVDVVVVDTVSLTWIHVRTPLMFLFSMSDSHTFVAYR